MSAAENFPRPKYVEGGCLCGSLRYRVEFSNDHDFSKSSGTCQCTMDRKATGSLWFQYHQVRANSAFRFTSPTASLKHYISSAGTQRGFCGECGSFLYVRPAASEDYKRVTIAVGSVDALYLFGEDADGDEVPVGGFGRALANGWGDHEWCHNEIPGVTDKISILGYERGKRWATDPA
ncbi:hypothetical protein PFICI_09339 [Pestalotiopsis fici W106-1]|uniref:CENP-V/GFA domain-containing protein n=1 Tax=Pestalotiopsis fici (strain W106-1 / CGMCC3.15140) TaxID=1229662 RepID=W3X2W0_PESFW|nr:uncharacterized protein PFICI_09339 [Pestalotiopsis fici W106-1]ETS79486.1 hypothetical protein PFICI_09339 [Pestalotiopsis fici W106-1]